MDDRDICYKLLSVLLDFAPDMKAQVECSRIYHKGFADGASRLDVQKMLVNALYDGLNHQKWPWTND